MTQRLLDDLELVRSSVSPLLIDPGGFDRIADAVAFLPSKITTFWGLESRLGKQEALADVLLEVKNGSTGHQLLAGPASSALDRLCEQAPVWHDLRLFAQRWADEDSPLHRQIRNIWLEIDTADIVSPQQARSVVRSPSIFFGPDWNNVSRAAVAGLIDAFLAELNVFPDCRDALRALIDALPDGGRVFQIGAMLGRKEAGLRICINQLPAEAIPDWLSTLGAHGNSEPIRRFFDEMGPLLSRFALGFNLRRHGIEKKIGLECYMNPHDLGSSQWAPLLAFLERERLCLASKRKGIMDYPGRNHFPVDSNTLDNGILSKTVFRIIHHLKLTVVGERFVEAKAYLALYRPGLDTKAFSSLKGGDGGRFDGAWIVD